MGIDDAMREETGRTPAPTDIALLVYSMGSGGVERMRVNLADALQKRGFSTSIVVARSDGRHGRHAAAIPQGVRLVNLNARSWKAWLDSFTDYLQRERPKVVLAAMETAGVIALWARRRSRAPTRVVVSSHVEISLHTKQDWSYPKRLILTYLIRRLYPEADGLVAVSAGVADDLARFAGLPRRTIWVIHNPVVTDALLRAKDGAVDHLWLLDRAVPLIIAVGRLTQQKDFGTLLQALARLRRDRPARLMILGEGEDRARLQAFARELGIAEHVAMLGFTPNPPAYVAKASLFVLSSAWEGFGNALVEALACGCPVVSTDCPSGPSEILSGGAYGSLVPVGDAEAMAAAMAAALDNPPDSRALTERAMAFHVDRIVDQYLAAMCAGDEAGLVPSGACAPALSA